MKNIFLILLFIFTSTHIYSQQQVYPLHAEGDDFPNNSYFKDMGGELDPYIGVWKGDWNGKTVYLELRKVKYFLGINGKGNYRDMILGERKIINSDGSISVDRISNFNELNPEFIGIGSQFKNPAQKYITFAPENMCRASAKLNITFLDAAKTQMSLHFIYNPGHIDESCQYYDLIMNQQQDFPMNLPKDIVLTKQ